MYEQHQQTIVAYHKWLSAAVDKVHSSQLVAALIDVRKAVSYDRTKEALSLERVIEKTEGRRLRTDLGSYPAYPLIADGWKAVRGKYDIIALATTANELQNSSVMSNLDVQAFVEREPIGARIYALLLTPNSKQITVRASVVPSPSGSIGFTGSYMNQRFGVTVDLPTLTTNGVSYGWIPSVRPTDGNGRSFTDPMNPQITITAFGSNTIENQSPSAYTPASAHVLKNVQIGSYPAFIYTDLQSANGVTIFDESIVAGSANLQSSDEVDVKVPETLRAQWQPTINTIIDSFFPGDLTQAH